MHRKLIFTFVLAALVVSAPSITQAQDPAVDLATPGRRPAEIERDRTSKPIEVLEWLEVESGDVVADLQAGSGYHSWIFSQWVGPEGAVYAQSSYRPDTLKGRIEGGDLKAAGNVHYVERIADLPSDSFDIVFTDRNYHDFPPDQIPSILADISRALKPGGIFAVIDARAAEGRDEDAHRIADDVIIAEVTTAGFELVESSELLANPDDDHVGGKFDQRDSLDRSLLKFQKPAAEPEAVG